MSFSISFLFHYCCILCRIIARNISEKYSKYLTIFIVAQGGLCPETPIEGRLGHHTVYTVQNNFCILQLYNNLKCKWIPVNFRDSKKIMHQFPNFKKPSRTLCKKLFFLLLQLNLKTGKPKFFLMYVQTKIYNRFFYNGPKSDPIRIH